MLGNVTKLRSPRHPGTIELSVARRGYVRGWIHVLDVSLRKIGRVSVVHGTLVDRVNFRGSWLEPGHTPPRYSLIGVFSDEKLRNTSLFDTALSPLYTAVGRFRLLIVPIFSNIPPLCYARIWHVPSVASGISAPSATTPASLAPNTAGRPIVGSCSHPPVTLCSRLALAQKVLTTSISCI